MLPQLLDLISRSGNLSPADIALCERYFQPLAVKKNTVVQAAGTVPQYLYFLGTGYMRLYYADEQGSEITTHLGLPGDFLTPFLSFIHQQPAPESLAAITACEVLRIAHADLAALIAGSEAFKQFSLLIFEQAMGAAARRANSLATLSAEQRYRLLLAQHPAVLLHVPVQQLASYLGIKPESLSRIRRQVVS
ncbi:Crp/Fnr family transcriptional regulator [Hymenobacter saemangeumensis]|uniref:Crp/Fnr family transcriptional regulator n=1 Tax=Hymenobacter saemangeumensis TaxID=1084522 RepID=A0ABP8IL05_9BACT